MKKIPPQKRAGGVAQGVGREFKPQYSTHTHKKSPVFSAYSPGFHSVPIFNFVCFNRYLAISYHTFNLHCPNN
jgi:hypothetical protein